MCGDADDSFDITMNSYLGRKIKVTKHRYREAIANILVKSKNTRYDCEYVLTCYLWPIHNTSPKASKRNTNMIY